MSEEKDILAAELALGLLEGEERDAAIKRQADDPAFAASVVEWRDQFAELFPAVPEETPPAALQARVMAHAAPQVVATRQAANDPGYWRPMAIAASMVALVLAGLLAFQSPEVPVIDDEGTTVAVAAAPLVASFTVVGFEQPRVAIYNEASETLTMPGEMPIPEGHSAQLWAEVDGEALPLGTFRAVERGVAADTTRALPAGTTLMISFEPEGEPVTDISGEVVAEGVLTAV